ncbi:MAG TPA: PE-PPE domain-containing protein [Mycobacterium sp.]
MTRVLPAAAIAGAAASAMAAVGLAAAPSAHADGAADALDGTTRITVPGAGPLYYPNFYTETPGLGESYLPNIIHDPKLSIMQSYDLLNHEIGENWFPGSTAQVVDYPASMGIISGSLAAPTVNEAVATGQQELNDQITNAVDNGDGSPVDVAALSEGTLVLDRELAYLATDPNAPPADALHFASFSNPELGLFATYMQPGSTIPVVNYTAEELPDTQYNVDLVFHQYDFWGNPPDRPWDLLADLNSLFALQYYHSPAALAAPSGAQERDRPAGRHDHHLHDHVAHPAHAGTACAVRGSGPGGQRAQLVADAAGQRRLFIPDARRRAVLLARGAARVARRNRSGRLADI